MLVRIFPILFSWLFILTAPISGFAEEEITVRLSTESSLLPIYIPPFRAVESGFDADFIKKLEEVLHFDFKYNGKTQVVENRPERESLAWRAFDPEAWRQLDVVYLLKIEIKDRKLSATAFSVKDSVGKTISELPLSGDLDKDRQRIHQVSDRIFKSFFGVNGIATSRILYTVKQRNDSEDSYKWVAEVWESDYDGGNPQQLTHEDRYCVTPTYLPPKPGYSSGGFFYVSYRIGQPKIFFASLRDGRGRRFSYLRGDQLMPAISPKRDQVAFICNAAGNPDLFIQEFSPEVGARGKPRQIFTAPRGTQASPVFSPDGRQIAFVSNKDGSPRIYVMDVPPLNVDRKDVNPQLLTKENRENICPSWSPDGRMLVYSSKVEGVRQIYTYDFESNRERQLTFDKRYHKENPTWAPDNLHIMFNAGDEERSEIYMINLHQSEAVRVTRGDGEKYFPSWEPKQLSKA